MIGSTRNVAVWAYPAPVDLRKGYDGLAGIVEVKLGRDPLSGDCYLFTNRTRHLAPTAEALHARVLAAEVILADETRWPLLGEADAAKWHAWGVACDDAISYRIRSSRATSAGREVLAGFAARP